MEFHTQPRDPTLQNPLEKQIGRFMTPFGNFIHKQTTASILLALATIVALVVANSPWHVWAETISEYEVGFMFDNLNFLMPLKEWISSGFMALFFFLIGLEIKREMLAGKLKDLHKVSLVIMAAFGGMIFPALIYAAINHGAIAQSGWAIPMATDTAFSLGVLALLTRRLSFGVSTFLAAMAIFDDVGAILVISVFYTQDLDTNALLIAAIVFLILFFINFAGVRKGWIYAVLGVLLWVLIHSSGVHATLAGLLVAATIPARPSIGQTSFVQEVHGLLSIFEKHRARGGKMLATPGQHSLAADIEETVKAASTPLQRWENFLMNPIGIVVLPLFALFNAGVVLSSDILGTALSSTVTLGVIAGLFVGKPLGICLLVWLGLKLKLGKLPEGMRFSEVITVGILAGIGFTMSIFITSLSFGGDPGLMEFAKIGIMLASAMSATAAVLWVLVSTRHYKKAAPLV